MNTNKLQFGFYSPSFSARNLVPLAQYKGPLLQLTESDKQTIERLKSEMLQCETALYNLRRQMGAGHMDTKTINHLGYLESCAESLRLQIRQVKTERLDLQKRAEGIL